MSHLTADAVLFVHVARGTPYVTPCHTSLTQGVGSSHQPAISTRTQRRGHHHSPDALQERQQGPQKEPHLYYTILYYVITYSTILYYTILYWSKSKLASRGYSIQYRSITVTIASTIFIV